MTNPLELFDQVRNKAVDTAKVAFLEAGKSWPDDEGTLTFMTTMLGIGVSAAFEHLAQHPEHLALAGQALCEVCREPVASWQVGVDPARDEDSTVMVKVAWPCGHLQPQPA